MAVKFTTSRGHTHTIGKLAKLTGVNLETIRYFEHIGLLKPPERTEAGHRLFAPEHVERLLFIRHARDMGFSQNDVRTLLKLSDGELTSCGEVKAIAAAQLDSIRQRIEKLQRLESLLASTVAKCSGGKVPTCPVIQALTDSAA
jgi:MerR family transcriptional regulator, mercuric resistance operon regulatory protein